MGAKKTCIEALHNMRKALSDSQFKRKQEVLFQSVCLLFSTLKRTCHCKLHNLWITISNSQSPRDERKNLFLQVSGGFAIQNQVGAYK